MIYCWIQRIVFFLNTNIQATSEFSQHTNFAVIIYWGFCQTLFESQDNFYLPLFLVINVEYIVIEVKEIRQIRVLLRKSRWLLLIIKFSSRKFISLLFIIVSIELPTTDVRLIGLLLTGGVLSPILCIGVTFANLQISEYFRIYWIVLQKSLPIWYFAFFKT